MSDLHSQNQSISHRVQTNVKVAIMDGAEKWRPPITARQLRLTFGDFISFSAVFVRGGTGLKNAPTFHRTPLKAPFFQIVFQEGAPLVIALWGMRLSNYKTETRTSGKNARRPASCVSSSSRREREHFVVGGEFAKEFFH